jgi:tRNA (guanine-N7-)-methyltransferase
MRKKLLRFQDNAQRDNVIEPGKPSYQTLKGQWASAHFGNEHELVLELGCGQGEYTTGLAERFPQKNFIGIDVKGARLWVGSGYALAHQLSNVAFLRIYIRQLADYFARGEIAEIYLPFPDPRPRERDEKRRLTGPPFLDLYRQVLRPGGKIHLKTDNDMLFRYTLKAVQSQVGVADLMYTLDFYHDSRFQEANPIQTKYEKKYLSQGIKIKYLSFSLK